MQCKCGSWTAEYRVFFFRWGNLIIISIESNNGNSLDMHSYRYQMDELQFHWCVARLELQWCQRWSNDAQGDDIYINNILPILIWIRNKLSLKNLMPNYPREARKRKKNLWCCDCGYVESGMVEFFFVLDSVKLYLLQYVAKRSSL